MMMLMERISCQEEVLMFRSYRKMFWKCEEEPGHYIMERIPMDHDDIWALKAVVLESWETFGYRFALHMRRFCKGNI